MYNIFNNELLILFKRLQKKYIVQLKNSPVGTSEIDAETSDFGGEDEDEDVVVPVELFDNALTRTDRR